MVPAIRAADSIKTTAESLQEDLARLELQKRALERELAAVAAHLDSVQRALGALSTLISTPARPSVDVHADTEDPAQAHGADSAAEPSAGTAVPPSRAGGRKRRPPRAQASDQQTYGKLTEQILEYFASVPGTEVRARDVAAALGRDTDSGSINAVRSTLDRLVGASRIHRAGRGLYRAK
ncbi:hypothetical protein ABZ733_29440 [Streptomyces longwoodensis]|uniref:hypothetical protein n=1 Tax=Streptomyces longwoodensis TaxID=68231 RepID=UPI0033F1B19A